MVAPKNCKWFLEVLGPDEGHLHGIKTVLFSKETPFQHIEVVDLGDYGRALVLDGKVQSTAADEFIYHEALVHPALLAHPDPRRVMVIGGGEGATLREVLRHCTVTRAVMVDIDREVVEVCRSLLPEFHGGAFDDPRAELVFEDARQWIEAHDERFDVIIIDLSDPIEEGPCYRLYTREFYRVIHQRLAPDGVIALQAGTVAVQDLLNFSAIHRTLSSVFPIVCPYTANVPCFGLPWGFQAASKQVDPRTFSVADYEERIRRRITGELKYLTGALCVAQWALPKHIQARLVRETRLIEDDAPLYTYHAL
jgi:spermidine synthase